LLPASALRGSAASVYRRRFAVLPATDVRVAAIDALRACATSAPVPRIAWIRGIGERNRGD